MAANPKPIPEVLPRNDAGLLYTLCSRVGLVAPEFIDFVISHDRVPLVEMGEKPWEYPGWLLWSVVLASFNPTVVNRWDYWYRTVCTHRILDEPIPRINFASSHAGSGAGLKQVEKLVDICFHESGGWSSVRTLVEYLAWGLNVSKEKPKISDKLAEQLYRTFDLEPWLTEPSDYLGTWIATSKGRGRDFNPAAFYPTAHEVCECMAAMVCADEDREALKRKDVCDPCVGTGRMLLHASNHCLRLAGADIDGLVLMVCKINLALYAPWGAFPFPKEFFE